MKTGSEQGPIDACATRISAVTKYVTGNAQIKIASATYTAAQAIAIYQSELTAIAAVTAARSALASAIVARDTADTARRAFDKGLKSWVFTEFGETSQATSDFGFQPKTPVKSAATKALAAAKAAATRKARNPLTKAQKKTVKGAVVALAVQQAAASTTAAAAAVTNG